jgi:RNA 3'-terminal phosphate cyclase (ATP)
MAAATTTIDGSYGEGGGQILRNACTYAAILRTNVRITNIRAGRKIPGLRPQHLVGLRLLAAVSGGCLAEGNHIGSTEILFVGDNNNNNNNRSLPASKKRDAITNSVGRKGDNPCGEEKREYVCDTQTAGSVCLLMQTILPFALFRGTIANKSKDGGNDDDDELLRFVLKGGTDADFAPPLDYYRYVFLPMLRNYSCLGGRKIDAKHGIEEWEHAIELSLIRRGFYPRGGGEVRVAIHRLSSNALPLPLPAIRLTERGTVVGIIIRAFAAGNCQRSMAQTLSATVQKLIVSNPRYKTVPITIDVSGDFEPSLTTDKTTTDRGDRRKKRRGNPNSGCGVLITAETDKGCLLGGSSIGSPKIPLEETAKMATKEIVEAMDGGGCVDDYLQDQLILYMALADGVSEIVTNSLTLHAQTAIWLASKMLPSARFEVTKLGTAEDDAQIRGRRDGTEPPPIGANHNNDDGTSEKNQGCHRIRCHGISFRPSLD